MRVKERREKWGIQREEERKWQSSWLQVPWESLIIAIAVIF